MPEATATNVRVEIDTELTDSDLSDILDVVEREWKRDYDSSDFEDTQHIQDFEAVLAALRIAEGRGRRAESQSRESASITYEASEVDSLRQRVRRADPGDVFGHPSGVTRDADRYSTSVTPNS